MMHHKQLDEQDENQAGSLLRKAVPSAWLKRTWFLCLFFSVVYILVAIISADDNHKSDDGTKALGFAALWTASIMTVLVIASAFVVFKGESSAHHVGLLIGSTGMMSQLFFILMIVFFVYSEHASKNGNDVKSSDKAMGSFCLFSSLVFGAWTTLLYTYRNDVICTSPAPIAASPVAMSSHPPVDEEKVQLKVKGAPGKMSTTDASGVAGGMDADEVVDIDLEEDSEAL